MANYFFLLDASLFESRMRPALAESSRRRSFGPCRDLAAALLPAARKYAADFHVGDAESLVAHIAHGLPFDRSTWRGLVSDVLLFGASEIPELQTCPETLTCLLAPSHYQRATTQRNELASIQQAHRGSRDLTFGAAIYRPEQAGYNNAADVARLAKYLVSVRPEQWTVADLVLLRDVPEEDREEELAFAHEWFPVLSELFQRAHRNGRVIVHECIY